MNQMRAGKKITTFERDKENIALALLVLVFKQRTQPWFYLLRRSHRFGRYLKHQKAFRERHKVLTSVHWLRKLKNSFVKGFAFGMMLTHSNLLESFKDLEPYAPMSELNSLKASSAELEKHGFIVSESLARINKLMALKYRQLKTVEERNGFDMALKEGLGEMEHKIVELERQLEALKEQRDAAYQNVCEMESCANIVHRA